MHNSGKTYGIFSKIITGIIYLAFFGVQFNIHLNGSPSDISYFSSDYTTVNCNSRTVTPNHHGFHKESKRPNFKLNKRFHPKDLFTAPLQSTILVKVSYQIQSPLLNEQQPLTNYSFNSPSLRGPPAVV